MPAAVQQDVQKPLLHVKVHEVHCALIVREQEKSAARDTSGDII